MYRLLDSVRPQLRSIVNSNDTQLAELAAHNCDSCKNYKRRYEKQLPSYSICIRYVLSNIIIELETMDILNVY